MERVSGRGESTVVDGAHSSGGVEGREVETDNGHHSVSLTSLIRNTRKRIDRGLL